MRIPPGEYIADELQFRGWTWQTLANRMGVDRFFVGSLVLGHRKINAEVSQLLGKALGCSPKLFLRLQESFDN
jgi:HTH-type transcriptional regulator/antitoxin HigA